MVLGTLVGVLVFSVIWCQSVECAFTSLVSMESVMLVMCSMQYVMSASSVA